MLIEQKKNVYIIHTNNGETVLSMCIKAGSNQDKKGLCGTAHLCEHINLYLRHSTDDIFAQNKFRFRGYTNFDHLVLKVFFPTNKKNLCLCEDYIKYTINTTEISNKIFTDSQREILDECFSLKKHWMEQMEIIRFLTDNKINKLPVGIPKEILKICSADIIEYIERYYYVQNISFIFETSLSMDMLEELMPWIFIKQESKKKIEINTDIKIGDVSILKSYNDKITKVDINFELPFPINDIKTRLIVSAAEVLISDFISKSMSLDNKYIEIRERHLSVEDSYIVLSLSLETCEYCYEEIEEIIKMMIASLQKQKLIKEEIDEVKKMLLLSSKGELSREALFQMIFTEIYYKTPILLDSVYISRSIKELKVDELQSVYDKIVYGKCRIVCR